ncbi:ATP/GTP-binding protein [Nocardia sp. NPDC050175]|uniref:ATP/GTP-binding protein n=1 Tax=Nocardia sp. NPDC050175 TaxID=3364317 RepID=UPI00378B76D2
MLQSFRFANHRSFRDEQQLNLMPAFPGDYPDAEVRPVPVVGVFGGNASGKSNVLDALDFMRRFVLGSDRDVEPGQGLRRNPFQLVHAAQLEPSRYVVDLLLGGEHHAYGFTVDNNEVLEEWLYYYPRTDRYHKSGREQLIFARTGDDFEWGPEYRSHSDLRDIAGFTAPTALYLSTAARFKLRVRRGGGTDENRLPDPLHDAYRWFRAIRMRRGSSGLMLPPGRPGTFHDDRLRDRLAGLLRVADFGIAGIELAPGDPDARRLVQELTEAGEHQKAQAIRAATRDRLLFQHKGADGDVLMEFDDESRGTRQLLELGVDAIDVLDRGGLLLVDEIDVSLHPLLSATSVELFRSPLTNPHGAQLIFTSHDAALLGHLDGEEVLKRDEIWFTEKGDDGRSLLYSLSEFKPRKNGENRERRYLNGSYGAVPDISSDLVAQAMRGRGGADGSAAE